MGATSRRKGAAGERELAALLASVTGHTVRRRVRQHDGDSDLEGVPGWAVECKRYRTAQPADLAAWWAQAVRQAERAGQLPVLFVRVDRQGWRAIWPAHVHLAGSQPSHDVADTLQAEVAVWWRMAGLAQGG